jgi:hypothetical protein
MYLLTGQIGSIHYSYRCRSIPAKGYTCCEDGWADYPYAGAEEYSISVDRTGGK